MLSIKVTGQDPIYLPVATEESEEACRRWYDNTRKEVADPGGGGEDDWPAPDLIPPPSPEIGLWFFPIFGARRWARGDFLIDSTNLALLRTQLGYSNRVELTFNDETRPAVTFDAYVMQVRPLVENNSADDDLHVITLVDKRYYWQFSHSAQTSGGQTFSSWTNLFASFSARIGQTIVVADAPDPDYLAPTVRWSGERTYGVQTTHLIDAACHMIGSRIVFAADGSAWVQRPTTTNREVLTTYHTTYASDHHGGGRVVESDIADSVPENVSAIFAGSPPEVLSNTLSSLMLPLFGAATASTNGTAWIWVDAPSSLPAGVKTALAEQAARDWYNWQMAPLDAQYSGFTPVPLSGFAGHMEYWHTADEGMTRIVRPPHNYGAEGRGRSFSSEPEPVSAIVRVVSGVPNSYTTRLQEWDGAVWTDVFPNVDYSPCRNTASLGFAAESFVLAVGTLCHLSNAHGGGYAIEPCSDYATATTPGLVSIYDQQYWGNKRFGAGIFVDNGAIVSALGWGNGPNALLPGTVANWIYTDSYLEGGSNTFVVRHIPGGVYSPGGAVIIGRDFHDITTGRPSFAKLTGSGGGPGFGTAGTLFVNVEYVWSPHVVGLAAESWFTFHTFASRGVSGSDLESVWAVGTSNGPGLSQPESMPSTIGAWYCSTKRNSIADPLDVDQGQANGGYHTGLRGISNGFPFAFAFEANGHRGIGSATTVVRTWVDGRQTFDPESQTWGNVQHEVWIDGGIVTRWYMTHPGRIGDGTGVRVTSNETIKTLENDTSAGPVYYADKVGSRASFYLSPSAKVGERYEIIGRASGGWEVLQYAGQTIRGRVSDDSISATATTTGTAGSLRGVQYGTVVLECITEGTEFLVIRNSAPITFI